MRLAGFLAFMMSAAESECMRDMALCLAGAALCAYSIRHYCARTF